MTEKETEAEVKHLTTAEECCLNIYKTHFITFDTGLSDEVLAAWKEGKRIWEERLQNKQND